MALLVVTDIISFFRKMGRWTVLTEHLTYTTMQYTRLGMAQRKFKMVIKSIGFGIK